MILCEPVFQDPGKAWSPIAVLPNVDVNTRKLAGHHIALIGAGDPRYAACVQDHPDLGTFLASFTGSHGERVRPSLIVVNTEFAGKAPSSAVASFKDIIVASVVLDARVGTVVSGFNRGPFYSNSFDIYPWMVTEREDRVVARTPAITALHRLKNFRGIASPGIPVHEVGDRNVHARLFASLYRLWERQYVYKEGDWSSRAVLRSLNMATAAMQVPGMSAADTFYDWGRSLALWVSSFEILVHPGGGGRADHNRVLEMLSDIRWQCPALKNAAYQLTVAGKRESRTLPEWLYTRLYRLRNDYLHGNPVEPAGFDMDNGTSVLSYPAALYRMALASKVPVEDPVTHDDVKSGLRSLDDYGRFYRSTLFQSSCEDCLLRAVDPEAMKEEEE